MTVELQLGELTGRVGGLEALVNQIDGKVDQLLVARAEAHGVELERKRRTSDHEQRSERSWWMWSSLAGGVIGIAADKFGHKLGLW